jgi:hypothetical protein
MRASSGGQVDGNRLGDAGSKAHAALCRTVACLGEADPVVRVRREGELDRRLAPVSAVDGHVRGARDRIDRQLGIGGLEINHRQHLVLVGPRLDRRVPGFVAVEYHDQVVAALEEFETQRCAPEFLLVAYHRRPGRVRRYLHVGPAGHQLDVDDLVQPQPRHRYPVGIGQVAFRADLDHVCARLEFERTEGRLPDQRAVNGDGGVDGRVGRDRNETGQLAHLDRDGLAGLRPDFETLIRFEVAVLAYADRIHPLPKQDPVSQRQLEPATGYRQFVISGRLHVELYGPRREQQEGNCDQQRDPDTDAGLPAIPMVSGLDRRYVRGAAERGRSYGLFTGLPALAGQVRRAGYIGAVFQPDCQDQPGAIRANIDARAIELDRVPVGEAP